MKSGVAQMNSGSSYERKEAYSPRQRSSSPEDRYVERRRSRSPKSKGNSDHSRSDRKHSEKGHYGDRYPASRRERQERERESDWRKYRKSPSPNRRSAERATTQSSLSHDEPPSKKKKEDLDPILTRTGGAYIPPAKLRMMQAQITDRNSLAYQRMNWEALKKSINGLINKVNVSNIENIIHELLQENIVRGRGLLARSILQAQSASPIFTHVYAAVVSIINSKFPNIGELILKRLILNFRKGYRRNDKQLCLTASKFVAHLMNQNVAHEVLCLEMLTLLLERPTDDSIEVAIGFLKECGLKLTEVSPRGVNAIFDRLRHVLHESETDKRIQYMIEVMFAVRKDGFKDHPIIPDGLDLVEEEDQFTHMLPLEDDYNPDDVLNVFKMDPDFMENEEKYKALKNEILDEGDSDSEGVQDAGSSEEDEEEDDDKDEEEDGEGQKVTIHDKTEINLVSFRRTIYLAIQSSLDFEECAHKLLKMDFPESQTKELCNMILDCCAQQRTYEKFFGLLAGRFCMLKKEYMEAFEAIFKEQYDTIHRLETNKLRNVAKMFAHLLYTDSLPWSVLECITLSEETTTSSSRIFVKIFFQGLSEYMGLPNLNARLKDETLQPFFEGLLPRDNPRNTRFAINFFTSIGLGGLTDELREHLKNAPKIIMTQKQDVESSDSSSESDSSGSDDDSSSSSSASSSESESSDSERSSDSDVKKRKSQKKKISDKDNKRKQGNKKKQAEKKKEKRQPERENGAERNSERNADRSSRDSSWRDDASQKLSYDRDYSSGRNSYWSGKDREQERNMPLESKTSYSKKKRAERRNSFSDTEERDSCRTKDGELHRRRKDRSKSRERPRTYPSPREDENSRYPDQFKESRKDEGRRRHGGDSPYRRR
ncbi:pre-mRNA-splicing factor CWC22 homolog [Rhineura floridana]|uniref:pre-mRNA-splicing factor CWC22 homolog n=1 Tax=Rhineura floridana TaxID=261503 RepID=UPI002AC83686|nr:pre-mRNA-splicing factor CWC22 homolog [Rhineura floridana]XP_061464284.1 pre-mRNA-splicing factor CWC22 homolog [Rhineura floridana]